VEDSGAAAESELSTLAEVMKVWERAKLSGSPKSLLRHTCWDTLRIIIEYMQWPARERTVDVVVHKGSVSGELDIDGPMMLTFSCLPVNPLSYLKLLVAEQLHPARSSLLDRVHEFNTMTLVAGGRQLEDWTEMSAIDSFAKNPFFHCYLKFASTAKPKQAASAKLIDDGTDSDDDDPSSSDDDELPNSGDDEPPSCDERNY
jgi:hypothetical protein